MFNKKENIVSSTLKVTASDNLDLYLDEADQDKEHKSIAELLHEQKENEENNENNEQESAD